MIFAQPVRQSALDPRTKLAMTVAVFIGSLGASTWPGMLVTLGAVLTWSAAARVPRQNLVRGLRAVRILFVFTLLFHALLGTGEPWFAWGPIAVTRSGVLKGIWMSMRLALMVLAATVLTSTSSPLQLTQGLDAALAPLQRFGVPTREFTMIVGISLRFLPVLADEAKRIQEAQMLRGVAHGSRSVAARIRSLVPVLVPLLGGALRRAEELGEAMAARAYGPGSARTYLHPLHFTYVDAAVTIGSLAAGIAVAVWL